MGEMPRRRLERSARVECFRGRAGLDVTYNA